MRGLRHELGEGPRRIDPMAVHADIDLVAVDRARSRASRRIRPAASASIAPSMRAPAAELDDAAPLQAAHRRLDAQARVRYRARPPRRRAAAPSRSARRRIGARDRAERLRQRVRRLDQPVDRRPQLGLEAVALIALGARAPAPAGAPARGTPRSRRCGRPSATRCAPALARQHARARPRPRRARARRPSSPATRSSSAPAQAAGARAAALLGAEQPAPQLRRLAPGQLEREGAVGGVEHVVALVEDIARRQVAVVEPAERRLDHHQRMVGDDDARAARAAHALLDEAAVVMRAGAVDAFAAPVGEAQRLRRGRSPRGASRANRRRPCRRRASRRSSAPSGRARPRRRAASAAPRPPPRN